MKLFPINTKHNIQILGTFCAIGILIIVAMVWSFQDLSHRKTGIQQSSAIESIKISKVELPKDPQLYHDDMYGFSFRLPDGYSTSVVSNDVGRTVLISKAGEGVVGQLYIPIEGLSQALTPQLVQENFGANAVFDVRGFTLAKYPEIRGTTFSFQPDGKRENLELWFVRTGTVYQWTFAVEEVSVGMGLIESLQW